MKRILPIVAACVALTCAAALEAQPASPAATRLAILPGSKAEYRVREQLARLKFPNDAVGTTESVTGSLILRPDGSFAPESKLTVDLRTLKSDEGRRDTYLRENTLQTGRFPLAEFVPRRHKGLAVPLPASGKTTFQLVGDMTMHGVTSELVWDVSASLDRDAVTATASTRFRFATFKLTIPRLMGLISVDDDIKLQIVLKARRAETR